MRPKVTRGLGNSLLICVFALSAASVVTASPKGTHALIGSVETVDKTAEAISVKTADGTLETIKWTGKTTVHGLDQVVKAADLAGREGSHIVVRYTVKGAIKTANSLEYLGSEAPKVIQGTIKIASKGAKVIVVKIADGADESFDLAERSVVETGRGAADGVTFTARETTDGAKVTVHYVEKDGRKVAHFIKHL